MTSSSVATGLAHPILIILFDQIITRRAMLRRTNLKLSIIIFSHHKWANLIFANPPQRLKRSVDAGIVLRLPSKPPPRDKALQSAVP